MKLALVCTQFGFLVSVGAFNVLPNNHHNNVGMAMTRDAAGEEGLSRRTFAGACATFAFGSLMFGCPQGALAVDSCKCWVLFRSPTALSSSASSHASGSAPQR